jgi:hypothetical protein
MKWFLVIVVGLVLIIIVVAVIGATLPRNHTASRTLRVRRAPEDVWDAITRQAGASGVPVDVIESTPPVRQVTRVKETEKMFGGTWTIVITPVDGGSTLTITEDGWVGNPIFRFLSRYIVGHHATMDGMLKQVAKSFGEESEI